MRMDVSNHESPTAAILLIGNELLSGKVDDENGKFLIHELRDLGVDVCELRIVPDIVDRIAISIRELASLHDHVFTSGGVGPTHDDLTMASVAAAFDVGMDVNQGLADRIRQHHPNGEQVEPWLKMANVPVGSNLLYAGDVWWPVFMMENVYVLPGIPEMFRRQFTAIRDRFKADRLLLRSVYLRVGEGLIAAPLTRASVAFPRVMFGSYPVLHVPEYHVKVTLESHCREELDRAFIALVAEISCQHVYKVVDS